jgi:hypothetical protein
VKLTMSVALAAPARLHRAEQELEIDIAVLAEMADAPARFHAERCQTVGDAVGLDVEFGEVRLASLRIRRQWRRQAPSRLRGPHREGSTAPEKRTCSPW